VATHDASPNRAHGLPVRSEASELPEIGNCSLDDVTTEEIERWLDRPRSGRGAGRSGAPATISKEVSLLRGLYRYARAREWITSDPTGLLYPPTSRNVHSRPVSADIWMPLWASPTLSDEARTVLGPGYFFGLRRAEIAALLGSNVQVADQRLIGVDQGTTGPDTRSSTPAEAVHHHDHRPSGPPLTSGRDWTWLCFRGLVYR